MQPRLLPRIVATLLIATATAAALESGQLIWLAQDAEREKGLIALRAQPDPQAKVIAERRWDVYGARPDRVSYCKAVRAGWVLVRLAADREGWVARPCVLESDPFIAFLLDRILLMEEYAAGTGRFKGLLPLDRDARLAELKASRKDEKRAARVLVDCLTRHVRHEKIRTAIRRSALSDAHKKSLLVALGESNAAAAKQLIAEFRKDDYVGSIAARKLAAMGPAAVDALLPSLKDPDRRVRYWTVTALCGTRDLRVVAPVAEVMRTDRDGYVRCVAAYYLRSLPAATEALIAQLRVEKNGLVAGWIARGLVEANRKKAAGVLAAKTEHPNEKVRLYALQGIVKFAVAGAHRTVVQHARSDESANVRGECIKLLGDLGRTDRRTLAVLSAELDAPQPGRVWHAVKALRKLAGAEHGYDPRKTPAQNAAAIAAWKKWCNP